MDEEQISVVIPVYNVEQYLRPCLDSVIGQTYDNLQIILVDDGSTDHSGEICDVYREKDSRVTVIHKENGGLSDARNCGIEIARGKYITFIDSDDVVDTTYCEELLKCLKEHNADISLCNVVDFKNNVPTSYQMAGDFLFDTEEAVKAYFRNVVPAAAWGKLYKRELFDTIRFPKGKIFEDMFIVVDILLMSNCVVGTATGNYYYRWRMGSITKSSSLKIEDGIEAQSYNLERIKQVMPQLTRVAEESLEYTYLTAYTRLLVNDVKDERSSRYRRFVKKHFLTMMTSKYHSVLAKVKVLLITISEPLFDKVYMVYHRWYLKQIL